MSEDKDWEIEQLRKQVEKEKEVGQKKAIGAAISISGLIMTFAYAGEGLSTVGFIIFLVGAWMLSYPDE